MEEGFWEASGTYPAKVTQAAPPGIKALMASTPSWGMFFKKVILANRLVFVVPHTFPRYSTERDNWISKYFDIFKHENWV